MIRPVVYALVCALLLSLPASAESFFASDSYWNGKKAYDKGDFAGAFKQWKTAADQGIGEAQGFLGALYHGGLGVEKDYKLAMEWYMKAAVKGVSQAQLGVGSMYGDGHGVEKDLVKARMWFSISAHNGNERAEHYVKRTENLLTPEQTTAAEAMAMTWVKQHER